MESIGSKIKVTIATTGTIIALVLAVFTLDSRYARAQDVLKENDKTQMVIKETVKNIRKQSIEDKIFELDLKKSQNRDNKLGSIDAALYERYKRQLIEVDK